MKCQPFHVKETNIGSVNRMKRNETNQMSVLSQCEQELRQFLASSVAFKARMLGITSNQVTYLGGEDFVLRHGGFHTFAPLSKGVKRATPQLCFENSFRLAKRKKWNYVEGYALNSVIPTHHAWVVNPGNPGVVIDPTWADLEGAKQRAYMGVEFNISLVREVRKRLSTILDDWEEGWPLLTGKIPEEVWRP